MGHEISRDDIKARVADHLGCAVADLSDDDNLIQMGLNSIRMMALAGGWRKRGADITFAQLAASPTVASWHGLLSADGLEAVEDGPVAEGVVAEDDTPFPLAAMQHAYWIGRADEQELGGVAPHLYVEFDGSGMDPDRLEHAVAALVAAHPMLRSRFLADGTQQIMPTPGRPVFDVVDLRGRDADAAAAVLAELRDRKTHQRLRVEDGQVVDITLSLYDGGTRLHLDIDMLAGDAMSYRVLVSDLAELYSGAALPTPGYSYRRYRTERHDDPAAHERDRAWWQERLPELPGPPELPTAAPGRRSTPGRTVRHDHWLAPDAKQRLIEGAHARGITPAMAVAAIFADTIGGWSAQPTFLLNVPLFHREPLHPDIDRVIGDFTSSIMLAVDVSNDMSVADRSRALQRSMYESGGHAAYSGLEVLRDLGRLRGEPVLAPVVFTSALDLGELFSEKAIEAFGEPAWIVSQGPQVLLDAQVTELRGGLLMNWDVRESAFPAGVIDAMFARFIEAVEQVAAGDAGWDAPAAARLPRDQARVRAAVNATDGPVTGRCLHQGFFEHAVRTPDASAVVWGCGEGAGSWTYEELAASVLAVAGALHAHGVRPGDAVAVQLTKGREQILAALGVLAAGATYVPIGFDQPPARRAKIIETARVTAALTHGGADIGTQIPSLSIDSAAGFAQPLPTPVCPDTADIAYLLFTSGSTGAPKGVEVSHRAAMNTIDALNEWFAVDGDDCALALSALEFDLSVYDIFGMFSVGASVLAVDAEQRESATVWVELLRQHRVSILNCVPSLLDMILEAGGGQLGDSLRAVILGGDWVGADLARRMARQVPGCRFAGLGGATETAIHSTICEVSCDPPADWSTVPFGVPLRNVRCRVVSPSGRDCPDWVPGELWVGGAGVATGYRNDPDRSAQRFVDYDGMRWYRTGDIARYWPDGTVEFLGRADNQVQIRGHRVELGEVEAALRSVTGVRHAVAVVVGANAPRLVAAVVGDVGELTAEIAALVPSYMVPARIVSLDRIPLTANGKLDRRAVIAQLESEALPAQDEAPSNDVQAALAAIAAEVLGVEWVGIHRDFFALGGDSVLATAMISRIRDWLDVDHAVVADVFATRTVAGLAERLSQREIQRGTSKRLGMIARHYLEIAALTDEEVLAEG